jgi:hypothetical protein
VRRRAALLGALVALIAGVAVPAAAEAQPAIVNAVAVSLTDVRVYFNEGVDPASVQPTDFALSMADSDRAVTAATVAGNVVTISSNSPWFNGEAGMVHLAGPGAVNDTTGAPSVQTDPIKVGAAPGDFIAPNVSNYRVSPGKIRCFCGRKVSIVFSTSLDAYRGFLTVYRGGSKIGTRRIVARPGHNLYHWDGRVNGRLLNHGRFNLQVTVLDLAGNVTPAAQAPKRKLRVG